MNSDNILEIMKLIHKVFPLPEDTTFKGTHSLTMSQDGQLRMTVWFQVDSIKAREFIFDTNETITEEMLLEAKANSDRLYLEGK